MSTTPPPPSLHSSPYKVASDAVVRDIDAQLSNLKSLEDLTERLLVQVAERDVDLDTQAEKHAEDLKVLGVTRADIAWRAAPPWVRVLTCVSILLGVLCMR